MSLFIETLKIMNGSVKNYAFHQNRLNLVQSENFGKRTIDLLNEIMPTKDQVCGTFKCSIRYSTKIESIDISPYSIKPVESLKLVDASDLDYQYKKADRSAIDDLAKQKGDCDDILMTKNGFITDTSYANVALFDGTGWFTPEEPLLRGTKREKLIWERTISTRYIAVSDLNNYSKLRIFNAMIEFDEAPEIDVKNIIS